MKISGSRIFSKGGGTYFIVLIVLINTTKLFWVGLFLPRLISVNTKIKQEHCETDLMTSCTSTVFMDSSYMTGYCCSTSFASSGWGTLSSMATAAASMIYDRESISIKANYKLDRLLLVRLSVT